MIQYDETKKVVMQKVLQLGFPIVMKHDEKTCFCEILGFENKRFFSLETVEERIPI